jgi:hypothetical protein
MPDAKNSLAWMPGLAKTEEELLPLEVGRRVSTRAGLYFYLVVSSLEEKSLIHTS